MREDKPPAEKKKEAVRPPRPIVKPAVRAKKEVTQSEEPVAAPAPQTVIIPEFVQAAEAEERAAKEAPPESQRSRSVAAHVNAPASGLKPASTQQEAPAEAPAPKPTPRPAAPPLPPGGIRSGPTGPRARTVPPTNRPNYAGQSPAPNYRPVGPRPSGPGTSAPRPGMSARPVVPGRPCGVLRWVRVRRSGARNARPSGPGLRPSGNRPMSAVHAAAARADRSRASARAERSRPDRAKKAARRRSRPARA